MYSTDFEVYFNDTMPSEPPGPYLQVRYDFNYLSFAFKYIGTLAMIDWFISSLNLLPTFADYCLSIDDRYHFLLIPKAKDQDEESGEIRAEDKCQEEKKDQSAADLSIEVATESDQETVDALKPNTRDIHAGANWASSALYTPIANNGEGAVALKT